MERRSERRLLQRAQRAALPPADRRSSLRVPHRERRSARVHADVPAPMDARARDPSTSLQRLGARHLRAARPGKPARARLPAPPRRRGHPLREQPCSSSAIRGGGPQRIRRLVGDGALERPGVSDNRQASVPHDVERARLLLVQAAAARRATAAGRGILGGCMTATITEIVGENGGGDGDAGAATRPTWRLRRGATVTDTGVTFSVWAPHAERVTLHLAGQGQGRRDEHEMIPEPNEPGVFSVHVTDAKAGDRYGFCVNDGPPLPDPASRSQPEGVHALSEVIDPADFTWRDESWPGVSLPDFVIYEMHVATFTEEGTFDAAAERLPDLLALGVTAIELMPVAQFPGRRNWGYDGVNLYAPQSSYGGPAGLKRLINAAHALGLGVVLDVVYNHVGPEGNYLDQFGPYFTDVYRTPWGRAVNYDGRGSDGVRRWALDNALYWICEYHIDALRLDAVHGIFDFGALQFLEELSDEAHELGRQLGR